MNKMVITLQRDKCIGCTFCKEHAPLFFTLSQKDGKAVLLNSTNKKGFHTLKLNNNDGFEDVVKAKESCPVKIIKAIKT